MKKYTGKCHCGSVEYTCDLEIGTVYTCNCSHCFIKGMLLGFIPESQFTLVKGEEFLTEYLFNKKKIKHCFCKVCGVQCFGKGKDEKGNKIVALNLRTIEDLDLTDVPEHQFNGKEF